MKEINITKAEANVNYLDSNEYYLINYHEGVCHTYLNPKVNYLRLWLTDEFPLKNINENTIFKLKSHYIEIDNIRFVEAGEIDKEYYVLCLVPLVTVQNDTNLYDSKLINVLQGKFQLTIEFSCDMIKGNERLLKLYNHRWPSFHDAELLIGKQGESFINFKVRHLLPDKYEIYLKIFDVYSVSSKSLLENFNQFIRVYGIDFRYKKEKFILYIEFETDAYNFRLNRYNREILTIECKSIDLSIEEER